MPLTQCGYMLKIFLFIYLSCHLIYPKFQDEELSTLTKLHPTAVIKKNLEISKYNMFLALKDRYLNSKTAELKCPRSLNN